jgi:hypothetical protein
MAPRASIDFDGLVRGLAFFEDQERSPELGLKYLKFLGASLSAAARSIRAGSSSKLSWLYRA